MDPPAYVQLLPPLALPVDVKPAGALAGATRAVSATASGLAVRSLGPSIAPGPLFVTVTIQVNVSPGPAVDAVLVIVEHGAVLLMICR